MDRRKLGARVAFVIERIEEWAARVAPTLTRDCWALVEWLVRDPQLTQVQLSTGVWVEPAESRALLAYRDKVAAGLSDAMRKNVRYHAGNIPRGMSFTGPYPASVRALVSRGLLKWGQSFDANTGHKQAKLTDFGREVARVLGK